MGGRAVARPTGLGDALTLRGRLSHADHAKNAYLACVLSSEPATSRRRRTLTFPALTANFAAPIANNLAYRFFDCRRSAWQQPTLVTREWECLTQPNATTVLASLPRW